MTTNIADSLNLVLTDERDYPMSYIFNFIAKKFGEKSREWHAFIGSSNSKFGSCAEKILRDNNSASDYLYVTNVNGDLNQFTVFDSGATVKVNLLEKTCSCRKYNLVKLPSEHAMATLRSKMAMAKKKLF
ncbi:uncharacterized protein LOC107853491 [Capsicum annuum]|uniref:uncharacterized protein LOC107853491 n=1 Tax=Capsicum annuum TaxID=4072 RepID=UPI001FB10B47|nr:uncharacterized protein LOC107853491 [Capsicum annuum]